MTATAEMKDFLRTVGKRIKTRRLAVGLTQEALAEQTDLSPTYIAKLEGGQKSPSLGTVLKIATALGLDTADLVRLREEDSREEAQNLTAILDGLKTDESEFAKQMLVYLVSYIRHHNC